MKSESLLYTKATGWDKRLPTDLDSENTLVTVFFDSEFSNHSEPLLELRKSLPNSIIAGCTTAGEIYGKGVFESGVSVGIMKFEKSKLLATSELISDPLESRSVGEKIGHTLASPDLKAVFILSEGIHVNGSEILNGVNSCIGNQVLVAGGLAGDGSRFQKTYVLWGDAIESNKVVAVGLYGGAIRVAAGSLGGWDVFGPERLVTKSKNNILFELDNTPALSLYKEYLGDRAAELPASALLFPLSLRSPTLGRDGLVRTILAVDEKTGSMTFAGDIPEGSYAKLMKANFTRLIQGASGAASLASKEFVGSSAPVCIAISCVGRKLVLGERTLDETDATLKVLPKGTKQVGFYSYGEISPIANGKCDLHNQTMTITLFSEA